MDISQITFCYNQIMSDEEMPPLSPADLNIGRKELQKDSTLLEINKHTERSTPAYYREFLGANLSRIKNALQVDNPEGNEQLEAILRDLSAVLPRDRTFKELASFISLTADGKLVVATDEGEFDRIGSESALSLYDGGMFDMVPLNTTSLLFLHIHPADNDNPFGIPQAPRVVGFSGEDKRFLEGDQFMRNLNGLPLLRDGRFRISLATAMTRTPIVQEVKSDGSWGFQRPDLPQHVQAV
jgi:hypothetical protein